MDDTDNLLFVESNALWQQCMCCWQSYYRSCCFVGPGIGFEAWDHLYPFVHGEKTLPFFRVRWNHRPVVAIIGNLRPWSSKVFLLGSFRLNSSCNKILFFSYSWNPQQPILDGCLVTPWNYGICTWNPKQPILNGWTWWNTHFSCNDLESSRWNHHSRLVVWSSRL